MSFKDLIDSVYKKNLTVSEKFDFVYKKNLWGSSSNVKFFSGEGSHDPEIVKLYVEAVRKYLSDFINPVIVDLGCGDFNIGSKIFDLSKKYYAVDIVEDVIKENIKTYKKEDLFFIKMDITEDDLPKGDICVVRQVLQHFSNDLIKKFLDNIKGKYKFLVVSEHLPKKNFVANRNINTGPFIRFILNSGVVLHQEPFNLKNKKYKSLLKIPHEEGIIETIVYELI